MAEKPSAVIVSSSNIKPKSLIKLISKTNNIKDQNEENIIHPWFIDTKYYTAEVNLIGINENYIRTKEFNENMQALIIHMDTNKESGLEDLKKWESLENEADPEIKLLIANYCTQDTKISKYKIIDWCLKRGYEFIELYPNIPKKDENNDDIIEEKFGVERIIEALQAHTWFNLVMKSRKKFQSKESNNKIIEQKLSDDCIPETSNRPSINKSDLEDCEFLTNECLDDFTEIFSQLHSMKDSLQSLPSSQKKQCAEQMVTAFWKAIGGEEEEIADL